MHNVGLTNLTVSYFQYNSHFETALNISGFGYNMSAAESGVKAKWSDKWLEEQDANGDIIKKWCSQFSESIAKCEYCDRTFCVKSGITNIYSHTKSQKHKSESSKRKKNTRITSFFEKKGTDKTEDKVLDKAKVAEIRVTARVVQQNHSFESYSDFVSFLDVLVPDSKIPADMSLGPDKLAYLIREALCPYLKQAVLGDISKSEFYTLQVDESNKQKSYLGVVVKYVDPETFVSRTACIDLPMLSHGDSEAIADAVIQTIVKSELDADKCLSIMTDNCNVMKGRSVMF